MNDIRSIEQLFNEVDDNKKWFKNLITNCKDETILQIVDALPKRKGKREFLKVYQTFDKTTADKITNLIFLESKFLVNTLKSEINKRGLSKEY